MCVIERTLEHLREGHKEQKVEKSDPSSPSLPDATRKLETPSRWCSFIVLLFDCNICSLFELKHCSQATMCFWLCTSTSPPNSCQLASPVSQVGIQVQYPKLTESTEVQVGTLSYWPALHHFLEWTNTKAGASCNIYFRLLSSWLNSSRLVGIMKQTKRGRG